jgi:hypothetical protein
VTFEIGSELPQFCEARIYHPLIYGGYEGCVGEKAYYPCGQDSQGLDDPGLISTKPLIWNNESCVSTGYTVENRTFWVLWGDPLDKHELNARTGFNPVVSFPFTRGPYPSYQFDVPAVIANDDSADARVMAKDLLVFLEMFSEDALKEFEVAMTEGAESGVYALYASKALEIARTTCTRKIYIFSEVPSYGYENGDASWLANKYSSSFLNSTECPCFNTSSCLDPTVTLKTVGWLPGTPLPIATGFDGVEYAADSDSPNSPWIETLVIPENPSGKIKTPRLPDPNRRICDGVYVWPMYFGMKVSMVSQQRDGMLAKCAFLIYHLLLHFRDTVFPPVIYLIARVGLLQLRRHIQQVFVLDS